MKDHFLLLFFIFSFQSISFGQLNRNDLIGKYSCTSKIPKVESIGNPKDSIISLNSALLNPFYNHQMVLKRNGCVKIISPQGITCYGLNIDNPTIYGRYNIEIDTIVITTLYSIQHFNKLAPKRRVKTKTVKTYKYKILDSNRLEVSASFVWIKYKE